MNESFDYSFWGAILGWLTSVISLVWYIATSVANLRGRIRNMTTILDRHEKTIDAQGDSIKHNRHKVERVMADLNNTTEVLEGKIDGQKDLMEEKFKSQASLTAAGFTNLERMVQQVIDRKQ